MDRRLHGGNIWAEKQVNNAKIIDFSSNINPLGISPGTKNAIIRNINNISCYPESDSINLISSLARYHNISPDNIAVGNGSIELIYLIPNILKPKKTLIITPSFSEYEYASCINNSKIIYFAANEEKRFEIEFDGLKKLIPEADLVFINNPNNPTGTYLGTEMILQISKLCREHKTVLVLDEAFIDFVENHDCQPILKEALKNKYLLILRSLTKYFALPGLRIGYAISGHELIEKIKENQYPWNINLFAQIAASEIISDKNYIEASKKYILREREYLLNNLKGLKGLKIYPAAANFILCKLENTAINNADMLDAKLIKKGIMIRNCANFRGLSERFFRVAVRKREENRKLIRELGKIFFLP